MYKAYVTTHYSGGSNNYDTANEAHRDSLRIMNSKLLAGDYKRDSRAEITGPNGYRIVLSPKALINWL